MKPLDSNVNEFERWLEPERWSARQDVDNGTGRMGAGFRALAAMPIPPLPEHLVPSATRISSAVRGRGTHRRLAVAALVLVATVLGGALAAAMVFQRLRAIGLGDVLTIDASGVTHVKDKRRRRIHLKGPISLSAEGQSGLVLSGTGNANVETGDDSVEIRAPGVRVALSSASVAEVRLTADGSSHVDNLGGTVELHLDDRAAIVRVAPGESWPVVEPHAEFAAPAAPVPLPLAPPKEQVEMATQPEHHRGLGARRGPLPAVPPQENEAALVASAFRRLRGERDPAGALSILDLHDHRFPAGSLASEASLARVEALLALGRRADALGVLDRTEGTRTRQTDTLVGERVRERTLLRGELRAEAGRCAEAVNDFARIEGSGLSEIEARAVWGRAACRARLGDIASARLDFLRYVTAFPHGASVAEARQWLATHQNDATSSTKSTSTGQRN